MGAAFARALAKGGHSVAAWNRTFERAQALAGDGITPVESVIDAVSSSELVVVSTTNCEAARSALAPVERWEGKTVVNLTSGTPDETEDLARWVAERGAEYLDAGPVCYPREVGTADALIIYSGSPAVWAAHETTLMALGGGSSHVAEEVGTAKLLLLGVGAFYMAALAAYVEAATYLHDQGVSAAAMREASQAFAGALPELAEEAAMAIESGDLATDQATLEIYADGMRTALAMMRGAGQRARIAAAAIENLEDAEAAGLGKLSFYAQTKVIGRGREALAVEPATKGSC